MLEREREYISLKERECEYEREREEERETVRVNKYVSTKWGAEKLLISISITISNFENSVRSGTFLHSFRMCAKESENLTERKRENVSVSENESVRENVSVRDCMCAKERDFMRE